MAWTQLTICPIEGNRIDEINDEIATAEAITAIEEVDEPANHVDERGKYF